MKYKNINAHITLQGIALPKKKASLSAKYMENFTKDLSKDNHLIGAKEVFKDEFVTFGGGCT